MEFLCWDIKQWMTVIIWLLQGTCRSMQGLPSWYMYMYNINTNLRTIIWCWACCKKRGCFIEYCCYIVYSIVQKTHTGSVIIAHKTYFILHSTVGHYVPHNIFQSLETIRIWRLWWNLICSSWPSLQGICSGEQKPQKRGGGNQIKYHWFITFLLIIPGHCFCFVSFRACGLSYSLQSGKLAAANCITQNWLCFQGTEGHTVTIHNNIQCAWHPYGSPSAKYWQLLKCYSWEAYLSLLVSNLHTTRPKGVGFFIPDHS